MSFICIKPACDSLGCVACNCAVPEKREEFERLVRRYWGYPKYELPRDNAGDYTQADVAGMWRAWCAAIVATRMP